jgi:dodecin
MAKKKQSESVYRIIDVVGVSEESWEDAGRKAVETAASSLRTCALLKSLRWI